MGDTKTIVETPEDFLEEAIATMTVSALISYENAIAQGRREGRLEGAEAMHKHMQRAGNLASLGWLLENCNSHLAVVAGMEASEP